MNSLAYADMLSGFSFIQELFPYKEWWVVPVKVAFDQTAWSAVWNSIYYTAVGLLRFDSPINIFNELTATFFPMLTVREPSGLPIYLLNGNSSCFSLRTSGANYDPATSCD